MSRIESELEDLAFAILEPDKYAWILSHVEMGSKQWSSYVQRVCTILRQEMEAIGLKTDVSGRVKHLYSFYKKLQRTAGEFHFVSDDVDQEHQYLASAVGAVHSPATRDLVFVGDLVLDLDPHRVNNEV